MKTKVFLKTMSIALACLVMFSFNSCKNSKDVVPEEPSLSIGMPDGSAAPTSLAMSADAGSQTFAIASNGTWKITKQGTDIDWVTVSPQEGNKNGEITITVTKNVGISNREAVLMFAVNGSENIKTYSVSQLGSGPNLSVIPEAPEVSKDGGDITFTITSNDDKWEYVITGQPAWLTEKEKTATSLTLSSTKNSGGTRAATITFKLPNHPSVSQVVDLSQEGTGLAANMLDVQFNLDGTAIDLSPMQHTVNKVSFDYPFTVSYNDTYKRNMVTFNPKANGVNPGAGKGSYYRIDYLTNTEFQNKLANSHSFECLIKFDVDYTQVSRSYETKFFSTHEQGGSGLLLSNSSQPSGGNRLAFLPNVTETEGGASNWIWTNSQVQPDGQSWYHLVGVWDRDAGKAFIYVNGEKKAEVDAVGYFKPVNPARPTAYWVAIGGDNGRDVLQNPFAGSLAIARIYDKALTAADAQSLWNQVNSGGN